MPWPTRIGRCWRPGPRSAALIVLLVGGPAAAQLPDAGAPDIRSALLAADDGRVLARAHREIVAAALAHEAPDVRVLALRAIGRTRRAEFLDRAVAGLRHESIDVRREAAFAVAHIGSAASGAMGPAQQALRDALGREKDVLVFSALAEEYGRLPFPDAAAVAEAARTLGDALARLARETGSIPPLAEMSTARGAEALARQAARLKTDGLEVRGLLHALHGGRRDVSTAAPDPVAARRRRLVLAGLLALDRPSPDVVDLAGRDPDPQVRRLGVIALARRPTLTPEQALAWLKDDAMIVRHAAVSRIGPTMPALAEAATQDAHVNVRLAALDALGQANACRVPCASRLERPDAFGTSWHEGAHALVAFARTAPADARPHVARAAMSPVWQVRMYAARAAALTAQPDVLGALAADAHVNVRHAALVAWREAKLPGLVDAAVAALSSDDGQLVLEAATSLKGAPADRRTVLALRESLRRLTALKRETSRDPRMALLERLGELDHERLTTLQPYVSDFDPAIAERAAALVDARRAPGTTPVPGAPSVAPAHVPGTSLPAPIRVPTWDEVTQLDATTVTFRMGGGRTLSMRLYARNAPTAVARLVAQVRAGEWNGRTFHRVEPGFVVQGGSPAANEYAGAAAFARDEFSPLSHVRGTVGISTRGPDTGDGQIFVNLVDNPRLDFGFTLIGSLTGDVSAIDDIVEGDVIESATVGLPR